MTRPRLVLLIRCVLLLGFAWLARDSIVPLAIPALLMPAFPTATCSYCSATPSTLQIVISGIANSSCTECGNLNGTFVTDSFTETAFLCRWLYTFSATHYCAGLDCPATPCTNCTTGTNSVLATIGQSLGNYTLTVVFGSEFRSFKTTFAGPNPPDCTSWSGESLPPVAGTDCGLCDFSSATCEVTAL